MDGKASITSLMCAFTLAYINESGTVPQFSDDISRRFFTDEEYSEIKAYILSGAEFFAPDKKGLSDDELLSYIVETQLAPTPVSRRIFCENSLKAAIKTGTEQYVILGAGLDTYAFRQEEEYKNISIFEADYGKTQEDKLKRAERAGLFIPENVKYVSVDFRTDNIADKLTANGYDKHKKTFFSLLGVSYYITESEFENLLTTLSLISADGSSLMFDYADGELFSSDDARVKRMTAMAEAGGEPMKFCADMFDIEILLDRHSFLVYEMLEPRDIQHKYFEQSTGYITAFPHISMCLAVLKGVKNVNTKEAILSAALELFASNGYDGVSVRDIASKTGLTQAALYKHYKNKRDIFDSIVKRMSEDDFNHACYFGVPEEEYAQMPQKYAVTQPDNLKRFAVSRFFYWTQDEYARNFRRMITVEQYKNPEMAELFHNHLAGGVIKYLAKLFGEMLKSTGISSNDAYNLAVKFYSPIYMLMCIYDSEPDTQRVIKAAIRHIEGFIEKIKKELQNE